MELLNNEAVAAGLTGTPTAEAVLSDGGIMSGVNVEGGSMPFEVFCWIKYMAKENCSRFSLPVCLVSASPLQTERPDITEIIKHYA